MYYIAWAKPTQMPHKLARLFNKGDWMIPDDQPYSVNCVQRPPNAPTGKGLLSD